MLDILFKQLGLENYFWLALLGLVLLFAYFVFSCATSIYTLQELKDKNTIMYNMNIANAVIAGLFSAGLLLGFGRVVGLIYFN